MYPRKCCVVLQTRTRAHRFALATEPVKIILSLLPVRARAEGDGGRPAQVREGGSGERCAGVL